MKKLRISALVFLLVLFVASAGWGVNKWQDMILQDCIYIEDDVTQTATITEINTACDGVTATAKELNALDIDKVTMFSDFNGELIDGTTAFLATKGSGAATAVAIAAGESGNLSLLSSTANASHAADGSSVTGDNLNWRADSGGLVMETTIQVDDITEVIIFAGFTDVISSTVEAPLFITAGDLDSDADNACGIVFDTEATTDQWCHGGVKATTDTVPAFSGTAPVNATDVTLRVEVSVAGAVTGYINGTAIGVAVADAVTATTALTPCVVVLNNSAAARTVLVDYIYVQSARR